MSKICLNVLVGIPGAGKTTFCKNFQNFLLAKRSLVKPVHLCFDDFIKIGSDLDLENGSFKAKRKLLLALIEKVIVALKANDRMALNQVNDLFVQQFSTKPEISVELNHEDHVHAILLDDNMYYRSMRYEIFKLARNHGTGFLQIYFDVPLEQAKQRNSLRADPIPEEIVTRMWVKMEKPNQQFYKWERNVVSSTEDFSTLESRTLECSSEPEKPVEVEEEIVQQSVEQSVVHRVDLLLRKTVGSIMKDHKARFEANDLKTLSEGVIQRRRNILEEVKLGLVDIDPSSVTEEELLMLF